MGLNRPGVDMIKRLLKDKDRNVRIVAMNACCGRDDIPLDVIKQGLKDEDYVVRNAAMKACCGRKDIPLNVIKCGLKDKIWNVRATAMNACCGRDDIPLDVIKQGLKDEDYVVRNAAMKVCKIGHLPIPIIRTIEPPELVYKKCVGDVIVVASIPKDAQVRGKFWRKCRASKAVIKDVIGDLCGERVGVSKHDLRTLYYPGDEIVIDDFDFGDEECSTGFHFFCTREEAEKYDV